MTTYSASAYRLAVLLRTSKTILVEGVTDRHVVKRFILNHELSSKARTQCVVDEAGLIKDEESLFGFGNKEKVKHIASLLSDRPKKFNWLIDREWEGMDLDALPAAIEPVEPAASGFSTWGHSVENYWFILPILSSFVRMHHGADLPPGYFLDLEQRFSAILRLSAAVSLVANRERCIGRCSGLVRADNIAWDGLRYHLHDNCDAALRARGAKVEFARLVRDQIVSIENAGVGDRVTQWVSHGHLGEEVLRGCAAHLASEYIPADARTLEAIERGNCVVKFGHDADYVSRVNNVEVAPMRELAAWAV